MMTEIRPWPQQKGKPEQMTIEDPKEQKKEEEMGDERDRCIPSYRLGHNCSSCIGALIKVNIATGCRS